MTPDELKITQQEYDALVDVRNKLCDGTYKHSPLGSKHGGFNMRLFTDLRGCGTAHCIGGFAAIKVPSIKNCHDRPGLSKLFYPGDDDGYMTYKFSKNTPFSYDDILVAPAIRAIDNYLETGDPNWGDALTNTECPHV